MSPVLVLLSGGMDSATCLWWVVAHRPGPVFTLSIDYRQRHRVELEAAHRLAERVGASHAVLEVDLAAVGGSPLTDAGLPVPAAREGRQVATVVPFRNLVFVSLAAAYGEPRGVQDLYLGPVREDWRAYRDCRREFYDSLEMTLRLGATQERSFRVHTPFVDQSKSEVVALGLRLGVPYELTHTCYRGQRPACGACDACVERRAAFAANGVPDPLACAPAPA